MPTIDGLSSGLNTGEMIRKLKQVEKQPIQRLEREKQIISLESEALKEVRKLAKDLQQKVKGLYSFEAEYESKKLISEPEGFLKGSPDKMAKLGEYQIDIKNKADKLIVASKKLPLDSKVAKGTIKINGKKADFKGGSLKDLQKFLNQNFKDSLVAKYAKTGPEEERIIVESTKEGKKGIFNIKDKDGILKELGVYDPDYKQRSGKDKDVIAKNREDFIPIPFDPVKIGILQTGPASISPDKTSLTLDKKAARNLLLVPPIKENASVQSLRFSVSSQPLPPPKIDNSPTRLSFGPTKELNIKGILLDSYNTERMREKEDPPLKKSDFGIQLHSGSGPLKISLQGKESLQQIPVKKDIHSIDFYTENTKTIFSNLTWIYKVNPLKEEPKTNAKSEDREQSAKFPNLLQEAKNAVINLDGVDIERESNKNLSDILDGVELDLLKKTDGPIKLTIASDHEGVIKQVEGFVEAYNNLLKYTKEQSIAKGLADRPGKFDSLAKLKGETGVLITNLSIRSMINGLKTRMSNAYPAVRKPKIKILTTLGISTGDIGSNWRDIAEGYLKVKEEVLAKYLSEHSLAVRDFFGLDKNQDGKIENGLGFHVHQFLQPYTRNYTGGIIYANIKSNEERLKLINRQIAQIEEKADKYEDKLKRRFGYMESAIQKQKAIGGQIKNRFGNKEDK